MSSSLPNMEEEQLNSENSKITGAMISQNPYLCKARHEHERFDGRHYPNKSLDYITQSDSSLNIVLPIEFDSTVTVKLEPVDDIPSFVENISDISVNHLTKLDMSSIDLAKHPTVKCEPVEQLMSEDTFVCSDTISQLNADETPVVKEEPKCKDTIPQELFLTESQVHIAEMKSDVWLPVKQKIKHEQINIEYDPKSPSSDEQSLSETIVAKDNSISLNLKLNNIGKGNAHKHMLKESFMPTIKQEKSVMENSNANEKSYKCTQCTYSATKESRLKNHMRAHTENKHNSKERRCKTSGLNTSRNRCGYKGKKLYKCDQCDFTSNKSTNLKSHIRTHTRETPYKCEQCTYSASRLSHLKNHIRKHTGEKPYACDHCEFATSHRSTLVTHLRKHTGEKPHNCEYCDYKTTSLDSLKRHVRKHTGEKPYGCNLCAYRASGLNSLKTHMLTHTGVKPFKCDQCEYKATTSGNLKTHMRKHTGTPYKCEYCGYKTTVLNVLKTHIYKHTDEKPYKCEECSYGTTTLSLLNRHMRSHTGGKPHKCDKCEHRASSKTDLKIHMQTHVNEKMHKCDQCEYRTNAFSSLKMHMRSHADEGI